MVEYMSFSFIKEDLGTQGKALYNGISEVEIMQLLTMYNFVAWPTPEVNM